MKPFVLLSHAVRAKEIFSILARHGFADLLDQLEVPSGFLGKLIPQPKVHRSTWERTRLALEELGPAFVKFGQLLSMRPDALPAALILELRKLQNNVRPIPFSEMKPVLVEELVADPSELFAKFNEEPVASASLAQVYFARLKSDGRTVAVKVQRPGISRMVQVDLDLAAWFAAQLHQRVAALRPYDLPSVFAEVRAGVERELDFLNEARNQRYFNTLNPDPGHVFAPAVVEELSTARVLVMEMVEGACVGSGPVAPELGRALAAAGAQSVVRQVLVSGFFHADPHAGNVMLTADGRLCLLDWGMVGHLTRRLRLALADFWLAAVEQDAERIVRIGSNLAPPDARPDFRVMEKEVTLALREELNFAIGRQQIGRAMLKLLFIFGRHGIPLSRDFCLTAKAVLAIEEIGRTLDPAFDLRVHAAPVFKELQAERMSPRTLLRRTRDFVGASVASLQELPSEIHRLVRRLEHDDLTLKLEHRGLDSLEHSLQVAANRIAMGVIIGSLIIGSSLVVTTHVPPFLRGYPALGIIGFLISAVLGLYVIWDIIRNGRHK